MKFLLENIDNEKVELYYKDLPITIYGRQRDADDWDEREDTVNWSYMIDKEYVIEFLVDFLCDHGPINEVSEEYIRSNFDDLFDKYYDKIADYFEEDAIEDAQENNEEDYDGEPEWDEDR